MSFCLRYGKAAVTSLLVFGCHEFRYQYHYKIDTLERLVSKMCVELYAKHCLLTHFLAGVLTADTSGCKKIMNTVISGMS